MLPNMGGMSGEDAILVGILDKDGEIGTRWVRKAREPYPHAHAVECPESRTTLAIQAVNTYPFQHPRGFDHPGLTQPTRIRNIRI